MLSAKTLILCAQLAEIAYLPPQQAEQKVRDLGCVWCQSFESPQTDTQAFAVFNENAIIITFRGTSSWRDVKTDFNHHFRTPIPSHPTLRLHKGFCQAVESLPQIGFLVNGALDESEEPPTIVFTGHSMGGAEAQIAAMLLSTTRQLTPTNDIQVVTFGSPMVTDPTNATHPWPFTLTMFETDGDPIPTLPGSLLNYQHLTQRHLTPLPNRGPLTPDHPIGGYIDALMEG